MKYDKMSFQNLVFMTKAANYLGLRYLNNTVMYLFTCLKMR